MRKQIVRILLNILNSRWLNDSPCRFAFVGNIDAFDYVYLTSEDKMRPGVTVRTILTEADRFRNCPITISDNLIVIEPDGYREATPAEIQELKEALK